MENKKIKLLSIVAGITCVGVFTTCLVDAISNRFLISTRAQNNPYSFAFNSGTNALNFGETSINARTLDGNNIVFSYNGLSYSENNFATFSENGSFFNPKLDSEFQNKISGISSIKVVYEGETKLSLSYGWLVDEQYEFVSHQINSNENYNFNGFFPSYFKLSNPNENQVNVKSILISYSCSEQMPHEHEWGEEHIITKATCDHAGLSEYYCSECGETKQIVVSPLSNTGEHTFGDYIILHEPTCVDSGLKHRICEVCGDDEEVIIPATGVHTYSDWIIDDEPTYTASGLKHHVCSVCDHVEYEEIEQLEAFYQIVLDLGNQITDIVYVGQSGEYSIPDPTKEGYNFVKWVDENDNDFNSSGVISENKTIYAVWEIDNTDTLAKLVQRAYSGVDYIKLVNDLVVSETIFVKGNVTIYSDKNISLTRAPSFAGDMFVVGENYDGSNPIIDGENPSTLNIGFDDFDKEITIDGNKDNVTVDVCGSLLYVNNSSTVNIYDGINLINNKKTSNNRVLNYHDSLFYQRLGGAGALVVNGNLNMYGGLFDGNVVNTSDLSSSNDQISSYYASYGGAVASISNFNMYGGTISNSQAARGGAIYVSGLSVLDTGTISNNKAFGVGGAIYAHNSDSTEIVLGRTSGSGYLLNLLNNEATSNGGAIYAMEAVNFRINGHVLFDNNYSNSSGGAIYSYSRLVIEPTSSISVAFSNNECKSKGGAIYLGYDEGDGEEPLIRFNVRIFYTVFNGNFASNGGAIYSCGADVLIYQSNFLENQSSSSGGAVFCSYNDDSVGARTEVGMTSFRNNTSGEGGAFLIDKNCNFVCSSQCFFYNNSSSSNGGAISSHGGNININVASKNHCVFGENIAGGNGGAIYLSYRSNSGENPDPIGWDSFASIKNITFNLNEAALGGAIYITTKISGSNVLSADRCSFNNNSSSSHGGALFVMNAEASFDSCVFQSNSSDGRGSAIYSTSSMISTTLSEFNDNNSNSAGAVALYSSTYSSEYDVFDGNINRAIYLDSSSAEINNSDFLNNTTTGNGGAINVNDSNSSLIVNNSTFDQNSAGGNGGAIMVSSGNVSISGSEFTSNISQSDTYGGGAMYATGATLSISDTSFETNSSANGGAIAIYSNTSLIVEGITAYSNSASLNGGFIYIRNSSMNSALNATVSTIGAENKENTAQYGGAISISVSSSNWSSTTQLNNFNISYNESTVAGGAIYVNGSSTTLNVSNSTLAHNTSVSGGAMYFDSQTTVGLTNTYFSYNSATNSGGAIYVIPVFNSNNVVTGHATITLSGCTFNHNSSGTEGGAIYTRETIVFTISSTTFSYNSSATTGGAISSHGSVVTIADSEFDNNNANSNGGALYLSYISSGSYDSNFTISGTLFDSNTATYGGAIYLTSKVQYQGRVELISCSFTSNESSSSGGAISSSSSTLIIDGDNNNKTIFSYNVSSNGSGSAIYLTSSSIDIDYCEFVENVSPKSGGAIYASSCDNIVINHSLFEGNEAGNNGGAIYSSGSSISTSDSEFNNNSSTNNGGSIYLTNSNLNLSSVLFVGNSTTSGNGGAIAEHTNSSIVIDGVTAYDNTALNGYGGFAYVKNSTLSTANNASKSYVGLLINNVQHGNTAQSGGAISLSGASGQSISFTNVEFNYNVATDGNGGAIILEDLSAASLTNCSLSGNTSSSSGGAVYLAEGTTLTINNCSFNSNSITSGNGGAIYSYGATITANNTSFANNSTTGNGGAIACERSLSKVNSTLNITNCSFTSNSGANGGAIYADYTNMTFVSGTMSNNIATSNGGAIFIRYSTGTINSITATGNSANSGGVFYINRTTLTINSDGTGTVLFGTTDSSTTELANSASSGGAIYATIGSDITINGVTFGYNTATYGGAITATHDQGNTISLSNCLFVGNKATGTSYGGGAIYAVGQSNLTIDSCTFDSNNAKYGAAIYANSSAPITILDTTFTNNTSTSGAAIYITGSTEVNISSSIFDSNIASSYGGAIYLDGNSVVTIDSESELINNTAKNGGATYIIGSANLSIGNSLIDSNEATTHGGGIYISEAAVLSVTNSTISSNVAANNGGGAYLYTAGTSVSFSNCVFDSNIATSGNGGGFYAASSCNVSLTNVVGNNNSASNGYGGFAGATTNVVLEIKGLTLSNNSAKTGANIRINSSNVTVTVNKDYTYSLNGSSLTTENQIKTMFSLASGMVINYETNE